MLIKRKRKRSDPVLWQKALHPQISKTQRNNQRNATKNFDYRTIANWPRTVSLGNDSNPTGVVKPCLRDLNFPTNRKSRAILNG